MLARKARRVIREIPGIPARRDRRVTPESRGLREIRATLVLKARRESEALQVLTAQTAHKAPLAQKETLVIPDRPARAPTPPLKLVVTRAHRPISTLTLPQCRGLRRRLRRFNEVES